MSVAGIPAVGIVSHRAGSSLRFYDDNESNYLGFKSPSSVSSNLEYTLPSTPGGNTYILSCTTAGVMSWLSAVPLSRGGTNTDLSARARYSLIYVATSGGSDTVTPNSSTTPQYLKSSGDGAGNVTSFGFATIDLSHLTGTVSTSQIASNAVTYAKMQTVSNKRILGRNTAGTGTVEEVTLTQLLDWIGTSAQGDILYRGASGWERLAAGTNGYFLKTQGVAANPVWAAASGGSGLAGWTDSFEQFTTTNATPVVKSITLPTGAGSLVEVMVVAWRAASPEKTVGFCGVYAGSTVIWTTVREDISEIGIVSIVASGAVPDLDITCTGIAATTIDWCITFRYMNT